MCGARTWQNLPSILTGYRAYCHFTSISHSGIMGTDIHLNCTGHVYICIVFSYLIWLPDKMENQFFSDFYLTDVIMCFFFSPLLLKRRMSFPGFRFIIHSPIIKFSIRW